MPAYIPTPGNITKLHIQLGFVNTAVSVSGTAISVNISDGFDFLASDAVSHCVIMIMGAGASGAPFWTTISSVASTATATLGASAPTPVTGAQAVMYRPLPFSHAKVLMESITGSASIRNPPTFDFSVYSDNGSFSPIPGQPVLITHDDFGDLFGGFIEQSLVENMPGTSAIRTHCEAVSWDKRLGDRLLYLASSGSTSTTKQFVPDGSSRDYHLDAIPLTVTDVHLEGSISISPAGLCTLIFGPQLFQGIATHCIIGGTSYAIFGFSSSTVFNIVGWSGGSVSGIAFQFPQTFDVAGSGGVPQWFYNLTSNTVTQAYQPDGTLSETLIPFGGVFDMVSVSYTYQAQLAYEDIAIDTLVETLIGLIANEGITTSITLASDAPTITKIQYSNRDTIDSALQSIIQQVNDGTNNYWYRVSPRKVLIWDIIGITIAAPFNISSSDGSDGNVEISIDNTVTLEKYVNSALVEVAAAQGASSLTQNITGGSPQRRAWTVSNPIATTPTIIRYTWNGSNAYVPFNQTVGLLNDPVTGNGMEWYWSPGSSTITQDPVIGFALGFTTGGASLPEYLAVTYFPQVSLIQNYIDPTAVAARIAIEGGSGEYDAYLTPSSLLAIDGSANANYAQAIVAAYNSISQEVKIKTSKGGLAPAQYLTLTIPELGVSGTYVVDQVTITDTETILQWEAQLVVGAVIGDWKTAWRSLSGGEGGLSGVGSQSQTQGTGTTPGGGGSGSGAAPTQFTSFLVTSQWSSVNQGELDLLVSVNAPTDLGTTVGGHIYLEIPDISSDLNMTIGSSAIGDGSMLGNVWSPVDAGQFAYVPAQQPWVIKLPNGPALLWSDGITQPVSVRVYIQAYSALVDAPPIQADKVNPTLSQTFTIIPPTSSKPGSGSSVTGLQPNSISATVDTPQTVGGQSQTPILVTVTPPSSVPDGWAFEVYAYVNGDLTTQPIFQSTPYTAAQSGTLLSVGNDGISDPHTFAPITPTDPTSITLYAVSGQIRGGATLHGAGGATAKSGALFIANQIVPGITPSCVITIGTTAGTLDLNAAIQALLDASVGTTSGVFGVLTHGITNSKLGSNSVATGNVQGAAITNPLLAALAVANANIQAAAIALTNMQSASIGTSQFIGGSVDNAALAAAAVALANMQSSSVGSSQYVATSITTAAIANAAITGALIANATITGAKIANATINTAQIANAAITTALISSASITTALIANLAVTNAQINDLNVSKLTAGSMMVSGTGTGLTVGDLSSSFRTRIFPGIVQILNASGASTVFITDGTLQVNNTGGAHSVQIIGSGVIGPGNNGMYLDGLQVVCSRQTGPGTPVFVTVLDAQVWCQNLYNALKQTTGHGLVT